MNYVQHVFSLHFESLEKRLVSRNVMQVSVRTFEMYDKGLAINYESPLKNYVLHLGRWIRDLM